MLVVIDTLNQDRFTEILYNVFTLRKRVLGDGSIWDNGISNGRDAAPFKKGEPSFFVSLDDDLNVVGCACVRPADGRHMISDMLRDVLDDKLLLESDTIWECKGFCVDPSGPAAFHTTCEIMIGILEHARSSGIGEIIAVIDPQMDRALRRSATEPRSYLGCKAGPDAMPTVAALIDCSEDRVAKLRAHAGIEGEIFIPEGEVEAAMPAPGMTSLGEVLQDYCTEQISAARTRQERIDAVALSQALTGHFRSKRSCDA